MIKQNGAYLKTMFGTSLLNGYEVLELAFAQNSKI